MFALQAPTSSVPPAEYGHLYVMTNVSLPSMVKIGFTTKSPAARAQTLFNTSVPTPFQVMYSARTPSAQTDEKRAHVHFDSARITPNREFFKTTVDEASAYCRQVVLQSRWDHIVNRLYNQIKHAAHTPQIRENAANDDLAVNNDEFISPVNFRGLISRFEGLGTETVQQ